LADAAAKAAPGAGLPSLPAAVVPGGGAPISSASALPRPSAGPGGDESGAGGSDRSSGGSGGNSGRGIQGGVRIALSVLLILVLLRLARRAAAKPIWRSYLPEVPPA
jgi:hypothetical protein